MTTQENRLIDPTSEAQTRVNEQTADRVVRSIHRAKHDFLIPYVKGQRVLDTGCGAGYGLQLLSKYYKSAVGLDGFETGIMAARARNIPNTYFGYMPLDSFILDEKNFDIIISVDLIQQLEHPKSYLDSVNLHLAQTGKFIVITPNLEQLHNTNPCHYREYTAETLSTELGSTFNVEEIYALEKNDHSARLQKLWKLDPLNIRNIVPRALAHQVRKLLGIPLYSEINQTFYPIGKNLANAYSLIVVCTHREGLRAQV